MQYENRSCREDYSAATFYLNAVKASGTDDGDKVMAKMKSGKYERIYVLDLGDIIEGIENAASMNQIQGNDLSVMQQVDLAAALVWDCLKMVTKYAPVTYASVASNHCQWRVSKQQVGEVAANLRKLRKPDPYKAKGVRYSGEVIRRKAGKAGKK